MTYGPDPEFVHDGCRNDDVSGDRLAAGALNDQDQDRFAQRILGPRRTPIVSFGKSVIRSVGEVNSTFDNSRLTFDSCSVERVR